MNQIEDKIGHSYKMLTVTSFNSSITTPSGKRAYLWDCVCVCGKTVTVRSGNLKNVGSCGCTRKINKVTTEELKTRLAAVLDSSVDVSKVVYVKSNIKIHLICDKHGDFYKDPFRALAGQGCPTCGKIKGLRMPFNDFLEKAKKIHKGIYTYYESEYMKGDNSNLVMTIHCSKHGNFKQSIVKHLAGQIGCRKCRHPIHDVETFIEKATEVHGSTYDYSHVKNIYNTNSKAIIICKKHGKFEQKVISHVSGSGCNSCSVHGFAYEKPAILYVLEIKTKTETLYKVGITNLTVNERFLVKELKYIKVLKTEEFSVGKDAYIKEQRILKALNGYKYRGEKLLKRGDTEIVTINPISYLKEEFNG